MFDAFTLFDWDGPSFGVGRRGRKLLRRGEEATARIAGITVSRTGSSDDGGTNDKHYDYALLVDQSHGAPVRMGCRQRLGPRRELVGLGSEVVVRHRKGRVIVDWAATLERLGVDDRGLGDCADWWKPRKEAVADGVEDHEQDGALKRIAGGRRATATVHRINALDSMFGPIENVDVEVQLTYEDGSTAPGLLRRVIPPDYAARLLCAGAVLPVGVDRGGERVTVDWIAAANAAGKRQPTSG